MHIHKYKVKEKNKMKKLLISFVAMLSVVFFFVSSKGYAEEVYNLQNIDEHIYVENNEFKLDISEKNQDEFILKIRKILEERNNYVQINNLEINPFTKKITNKEPEYGLLGVNDIAYIGYTEQFWWGVRRTFYDDDTARYFAHELRNAATEFSYLEIIFALGFPPGGAVMALGSVYLTSIANSVEYNAYLDGDGCILDINYFFFYSCYPR